MNKFLLVMSAVCVVVAAGCSNRAVYENMQLNQRQECAERPPSEFEACMERVNKTYDEYERDRQEILNRENGQD